MAPRDTENNVYAKFWGDKQRALWYVMVFLEWSIEIGVYKNGRPKTDPCGTPNELTSFLESYGPSFIVWSFLFR